MAWSDIFRVAGLGYDVLGAIAAIQRENPEQLTIALGALFHDMGSSIKELRNEAFLEDIQGDLLSLTSKIFKHIRPAGSQ